MGIDVVVEMEGEEGDEVGLMKERRWKEEKERGRSGWELLMGCN